MKKAVILLAARELLLFSENQKEVDDAKK